MSINTPQENTQRENINKEVSETRQEELIGSANLEADTLAWNQFVLSEKINCLSSSHCSTKSLNGSLNGSLNRSSDKPSNELSSGNDKILEQKKDSVSASSISESILQLISGNRKEKKIKISFRTMDFKPINVVVVEKNKFFDISINTSSNVAREKISKFKKNIEKTISKELKKRVFVSVK